MNEQLKFLVDLQEIDKVIDCLKKKQSSLPEQIEKIKLSIEEEKKKIEEAKKSLTQLQLDKKNQEIELDTGEQAMKKHLNELNLVKTNEAYKILISEIEKTKNEKNRIEEEILELMQKIEDANLEVKKFTEISKEEEEKKEKEIKVIEEEIVKVAQEISEKEKERETFAAKVSGPLETRYTKIRKSKEGLAVVPIEEEHCGGCRMRLPPHLINEVYRDQNLVTCEVCSRILYSTRTPTPVSEDIVKT